MPINFHKSVYLSWITGVFISSKRCNCSLIPSLCTFIACSTKFAQNSYCKQQTHRAWERGYIIVGGVSAMVTNLFLKKARITRSSLDFRPSPTLSWLAVWKNRKLGGGLGIKQKVGRGAGNKTESWAGGLGIKQKVGRRAGNRTESWAGGWE